MKSVQAAAPAGGIRSKRSVFPTWGQGSVSRYRPYISEDSIYTSRTLGMSRSRLRGASAQGLGELVVPLDCVSVDHNLNQSLALDNENSRAPSAGTHNKTHSTRSSSLPQARDFDPRRDAHIYVQYWSTDNGKSPQNVSVGE